MAPETISSGPGERDSGPAGKRIVTLPNVICFVRLTVSPLLIVLAAADRPQAFLVLYLLLAFSDWIDGKLAVRLNQRSTFGARLDTVADVTLYACLLIGSAILAGALVRQESLWVGTAVGSYAISVVAGWTKFGRFPAYHTRGAKTAWLLILISAWLVFTGRSVWMLRVAMLFVTLVNIESLLITFVLTEWRADVPSLWHALRIRRQTPDSGQQEHS